MIDDNNDFVHRATAEADLASYNTLRLERPAVKTGGMDK